MAIKEQIPIMDGWFNQDELNEAHEALLRDFIETGFQDLKGMLLISIRDHASTTSIECRGGSTVEDAIRSALCILEGTLTNSKDGTPRLPDRGQREVIAKVIEVLTEVSGGQVGDIVVVGKDDDDNFIETTRRPTGPGLEDDDDQTRH